MQIGQSLYNQGGGGGNNEPHKIRGYLIVQPLELLMSLINMHMSTGCGAQLFYIEVQRKTHTHVLIHN
jgi:hypothetical protein